MSNAGAHLMGAATYAGWGQATGRAPPGRSPKPMNRIPKVVFSNSLASADWGETTIAAGDLAEAVTRLKQERSGGYLLAQGGARFARSLVETGLIDEYRLVVHPVVLGAGERLFHTPLTIEPMSTTVFSGGAVAHVFAAHPSRRCVPARGPVAERFADTREVRSCHPTAPPPVATFRPRQRRRWRGRRFVIGCSLRCGARSLSAMSAAGCRPWPHSG